MNKKVLLFLGMIFFSVSIFGQMELFSEPDPSTRFDVAGVSVTVEPQTGSDPYEWKRCEGSSCIFWRKAKIRWYYPGNGDTGTIYPIVIISTAYDIPETEYSQYATRLASHGFVVIVVQHHMYYIQSEDQLIKRALDIRWIIDRIRNEQAYPELHDNVWPYSEYIEGNRVPIVGGSMVGDVNRIAMSGASFGAATTEIVAGARPWDWNLITHNIYYDDPRIMCALTFSSAGWGIHGLTNTEENPDTGNLTDLFDRWDLLITAGDYFYHHSYTYKGDLVDLLYNYNDFDEDTYADIPTMEINGWGDDSEFLFGAWQCTWFNGCRSAVWDNKCGLNGSLNNPGNTCHSQNGIDRHILVAVKDYDSNHVEIQDDDCGGMKDVSDCFDDLGKYQAMVGIAFLRYYMKTEQENNNQNYSWYWDDYNVGECPSPDGNCYGPLSIQIK